MRHRRLPSPCCRAWRATRLPRGVTGAALAGMIDGWEELLEPELPGDDALVRHAAGRGSRLFEMAGKVIGASETDPVAVGRQGLGAGRPRPSSVRSRPRRARAGACRGADRGGDAGSLESRRPAAGCVDAYRAHEPCRAARSTPADRRTGPRRAPAAAPLHRSIGFRDADKTDSSTVTIQGRGLCGAMLRAACRRHFW